MQNVPSNLQAGEQFKPAVVRKINDIIDYLKSQRIITDGKTIKANYGVNGIALSVHDGGTKQITNELQPKYYYVTGDGYLNYFKCVPVYEEISSSSSSSQSSSSSSSELPQIIAVDVIDGGKPENNYCGITDIGNVSKQRISVNENSGNFLVLTASYSGSYSLAFQLQNNLPAVTQPKFLIAELTENKTKLIQRWQGGYIYFGSRFVIWES